MPTLFWKPVTDGTFATSANWFTNEAATTPADYAPWMSNYGIAYDGYDLAPATGVTSSPTIGVDYDPICGNTVVGNYGDVTGKSFFDNLIIGYNGYIYGGVWCGVGMQSSYPGISGGDPGIHGGIINAIGFTGLIGGGTFGLFVNGVSKSGFTGTVYVSSSGSDTTGAGTSGSPVATAQMGYYLQHFGTSSLMQLTAGSFGGVTVLSNWTTVIHGVSAATSIMGAVSGSGYSNNGYGIGVTAGCNINITSDGTITLGGVGVSGGSDDSGIYNGGSGGNITLSALTLSGDIYTNGGYSTSSGWSYPYGGAGGTINLTNVLTSGSRTIFGYGGSGVISGAGSAVTITTSGAFYGTFTTPADSQLMDGASAGPINWLQTLLDAVVMVHITITIIMVIPQMVAMGLR